jgi:hypothetical protein
MSDDLTNRGPADRARISLTESWEVSYWCKRFKCTPEQLSEAVKPRSATWPSRCRAFLEVRIKFSTLGQRPLGGVTAFKTGVRAAKSGGFAPMLNDLQSSA